MSVVLKSQNGDILDNVFIFYDFKQVNDAVIIVTMSTATEQWEKIFIYRTNDIWETGVLKYHVHQTKYAWICGKLNVLFCNSEKFSATDGINPIESNAELVYGNAKNKSNKSFT